MAHLASSGVVTVEDHVVETYGTSRRKTRKKLVTLRATITLSSMGTVAASIPATAFGLSTILSCSAAVKSDNTVIVPAAPSANGALIVLASLVDATDATRAAPAALSGDYAIGLTGIV